MASITSSTQYLTFNLDEELYALEISKVREVMDFTKVTKVPRMPAFMRGVINLRGRVVPVVDLRLKFGLERVEKTVDSCIIIAEIKVDDESTILGALADSVEEVLELDPNQIEPAPKIGTRLDTEFIKGMGKREDNFIMILDIDKIFSVDDLSLLQKTSDRASAKKSSPATVEATVAAGI